MQGVAAATKTIDYKDMNFEQSAEQKALADITMPLFKFFVFMQTIYTIFAIYIGMGLDFCGIYIVMTLFSIHIGLNHASSYQFIANFIHVAIMFHGVYGVLIYGWGYGCENLILWGIATSYLMFVKTSKIVFITILIEIALYIILYIFRDHFGVFDLHEYKDAIFIIVYFCLFVSFFRRVNSLNAIYSRNMNKIAMKNDILENASKYDFLTGLDNRRNAEEKFNKIIEEFDGRKVLVAVGDIDNFKKINDTFGHEEGDRVLKEIGEILRQNSRCQKDIVCRWGGEEFLIVALVNSEQVANLILQRALVKINLLTTPDGEKIGITFGAVLFKDFASFGLRTMVDMADKMLYKGKKSGKNRIKIGVK